MDEKIDLVKYGVLWQKVESLEAKIDKLETSMEKLLELANQSKGGFWMGMAFVSALSSVIGYATNWLHKGQKIDPISLCLLAAGLVKNIQQGCELYKQAKESFVEIKKTANEAVGIYKEVTGFWSNFSKFFKPKVNHEQPIAKSKKSAYVAVDETQVKVDIVQNLTEFFKIQEQLNEHIRSEELKSKTIYDPNQNHMEAALKRVMAQQQMAELEVQIRECMVYQSPPEMGALYSSVHKMRATIEAEQKQARKTHETAIRQEQWQRKEEERNFQLKMAYLIATTIFLLYLWLWFLMVKNWGRR